MKDSTCEARTRTFWISKSVLSVAPAGCAPAFSDHSAVVASANSIYHQVQLRRQHLPAAQDAHHGGAQQHVRVAALVHRAGRPRVVHLVEALHGLVLVVLAALQQVMRGHGATVVVDVVAALAVGEDLDLLDETGGVRSGRRQRVGGVRVSDSEGDLDRRSMNEVPLVRGMRQTLEVAGEKKLSELGKYCTSCRVVT